jgi:hypothetical protein
MKTRDTILERRLAHRFLDVILTEKGKVPEHVDEIDDPFEVQLNSRYHEVMHRKLERKGLLNQYNKVGPETVTLRLFKDPGVVLKASDFTAFEGGFLYTPSGVGYEVIKGKKGTYRWLTLSVFWSFTHEDDLLWGRQSIEINPMLKTFRCPLCGDRAEELFLTGDPSGAKEHFGCVPCAATLDPKQRKLYEKARKKKPAAIAQPEATTRDLVTVC